MPRPTSPSQVIQERRMGCATWKERPHGLVPHVHVGGACRVGASTVLGGQVGSKASNSQFPTTPIIIFYMAKP